MAVPEKCGFGVNAPNNAEGFAIIFSDSTCSTAINQLEKTGLVLFFKLVDHYTLEVHYATRFADNAVVVFFPLGYTRFRL